MSDSRVSSFISSLSSQHTDDEQDVQNLKMWKHHSDFWSPGFIKTEQHQTDLDRIKWAQAEVTSLRLELRSATTPRRANRDSLCVTSYLGRRINQLVYRDGRAFKCFLWGFSVFCLGALKLIWWIIFNKIYESLRTQALVASLTTKSFSLAALRTI